VRIIYYWQLAVFSFISKDYLQKHYYFYFINNKNAKFDYYFLAKLKKLSDMILTRRMRVEENISHKVE